jgi:uncharacterized RDD family membrane protein YckC
MAQPYQPAAPTGPAPGVEFAAPVPRLIAFLIDIVLVGIVEVALAVVLGTLIAIAGEGGRDFIAGIGLILYFVVLLGVTFLYFPYFWANGGQTIGGKVMKIRVVYDEDGRPVGWAAGFVRLVGYYLSAFVFYIGFLWILVDKRKRGWADLLAGTCVIKA